MSKPPESVTIRKIVSGGQTGADRGGLEAAMALGIPHGGWCPRGRLAEDGHIPDRYRLQENNSAKYIVRTRQNVADSDATLVFTEGSPVGGSRSTMELAQGRSRPCLHMDLKTGDNDTLARVLADWLLEIQDSLPPALPGFPFQSQGLILNVAGSRESQSPGIQARVRRILIAALTLPQPECD